MWSKVKEVFTEEYRKKIEYRDYLLHLLPYFKLNNKSENVDDIVKRLDDKNFISDFSIGKSVRYIIPSN